MVTSTKPYEFQTFPLKYEIVTNKQAREVWVGNTLYESPQFLPKRPRGGYSISLQENFLNENDIVGFNPKNIGKSFNKIRRKEYCRLMGPKFLKRLNGAMYNTWIEGWFDDKTKKLFFNHGYKYTTINNYWVHNAHKYYKDVQELEDSNQHHLIPFVIYIDMDFDTIKEKLKPIWKDLEANSITRNKYIARFLNDNLEVFNHLDLLKNALSSNLKHETNEYVLSPIGLLMVPFNVKYHKIDADFAKVYRQVVDINKVKTYEDALVKTAGICTKSVLEPVTIGNNKLFKNGNEVYFLIYNKSIYSFYSFISNGRHMVNPPIDMFRIFTSRDKFLENFIIELEDYLNGKGDST